MVVDELIRQAFARLEAEGRRILSSAGWNPNSDSQFSRIPNSVDYVQFRTQALNLVQRVFGKDSSHYMELAAIAEDKSTSRNSYYMKDCFGALLAAKGDFESGLLFDLKSLVTAEVLTDFLDQAEELFASGYINPAASLAGAVLEDMLRQMCVRDGLPLSEKSSINRLNQALAAAKVYNPLVQKQITAVADIRNNADHARFDQYKSDDVKSMIDWVKKFGSDNLR